MELRILGSAGAEFPERILITHPKPQYFDIIRREIESLNIDGIELLHDGSVYEI